MKTGIVLPLVAALMIAGALALGAEPQTQPPAPEDRFEIAAHSFSVGATMREVYLRLDRFTGQTWVFDAAAEARWKPIPEQTPGDKPEAAKGVRYQICCHNFTREGKEQEIYLRFDRQTGRTWRWAGTESGWKVVEEDR